MRTTRAHVEVDTDCFFIRTCDDHVRHTNIRVRRAANDRLGCRRDHRVHNFFSLPLAHRRQRQGEKLRLFVRAGSSVFCSMRDRSR